MRKLFRTCCGTVILLFALCTAHSAPSDSYTLIRMPEGQEVIRSQGGESFPVVTQEMRGNVARVIVENNVAAFSGWGADLENVLFPESILVFVDGKFFYSGRTAFDQKWLVEKTGNPALLKSGFAYKCFIVRHQCASSGCSDDFVSIERKDSQVAKRSQLLSLV